jgi:hypothetical protein
MSSSKSSNLPCHVQFNLHWSTAAITALKTHLSLLPRLLDLDLLRLLLTL